MALTRQRLSVWTAAFAVLSISTIAAFAAGSQVDVVGNSVVMVYGIVRGPDVLKPWTRKNPSQVRGSGMVIEGNRILTNAHVIEYATDIQIQGNEGGDRISARVESFAPEIDLAVLKLDDESFFATHPPLKRAAELPRIKDPVLVYGYPTGGQSLSITKGIVSRIDFTNYRGANFGLRIQIDAAINHGNSGGPAMVGDAVIGIAYSFLSNAQNIGYIIPTEEIELMLKQVALRGRYTGRPNNADAYQRAENPDLRQFLKLESTHHGIVVIKPAIDDTTHALRRWDVITQVGDVPVDDQGMVGVRDDVRVNMNYLYQGLVKNGTVPVRLIRDGRALSVDLPVKTEFPSFFPDLEGAYPSYFIFGPMVFSRASLQLIGTIASNPSTTKFLANHRSPFLLRLDEKPSSPDEELVFITSPFFPSELTSGYGDPELRVVKAINGIPIRNLLHLVAVIRDSKEKFQVIEFFGSYVDKFVFRRQDLIDATDKILKNNGIRSQGTPDTLAEWSRRP